MTIGYRICRIEFSMRERIAAVGWAPPMQPVAPILASNIDVSQPFASVIISIENLQAGPVSEVISVSVPSSVATQGFSFKLPVTRLSTAGEVTTNATLTNGDALPIWLNFDPETQVMYVKTPPEGALPVEVLVTTDGVQRKVVIVVRDQSWILTQVE